MPIALNQLALRLRMQTTHANVSTLLTTVGWPLKPVSTGKGGRLRGSPR